MKVRYETQLDQLQKEHIQLLTVVEKLQREKNLDQDIITGIQKGMANIRDTYSLDVTRWKDERQVLNNHITKVTLNTIMLNNYITKVTISNYYNNSINYYLCMARTLLATREYKKKLFTIVFL